MEKETNKRNDSSEFKCKHFTFRSTNDHTYCVCECYKMAFSIGNETNMNCNENCEKYEEL